MEQEVYACIELFVGPSSLSNGVIVSKLITSLGLIPDQNNYLSTCRPGTTVNLFKN